jgi:putative thioredoxin
MVNALLEGGEEGDARKQFDILSTDAEQQSNYEAVRSRLVAAERAGHASARGHAHRARGRGPDDLQARLDSGRARHRAQGIPRGSGAALEIVRRDRKFGDDIGRRKMLAVFEMAAAHPELVDDFRSRLSTVLY